MTSRTHRIELRIRPELSDPQANQWMRRIQHFGVSTVQQLRTLEVFLIESSQLQSDEVEALCTNTLQDPILHETRVNGFFGDALDFDWYVEVMFRPGVTDNIGRTAKETFSLYLSRPLSDEESVYSMRGYFLKDL